MFSYSSVRYAENHRPFSRLGPFLFALAYTYFSPINGFATFRRVSVCRNADHFSNRFHNLQTLAFHWSNHTCGAISRENHFPHCSSNRFLQIFVTTCPHSLIRLAIVYEAVKRVVLFFTALESTEDDCINRSNSNDIELRVELNRKDVRCRL